MDASKGTKNGCLAKERFMTCYGFRQSNRNRLQEIVRNFFCTCVWNPAW